MIPKLIITSFSIIILASTSLQAQFSCLIGMDTTQSLANYDFIFDLNETVDGNIWVAGRLEKTQTSSGGGVSKYGTLIQLSPTGQILSSKRSNFRTIHSMTVASDGNFLVCGEGSGFMCTSGLCKSDMLVAKVTPSGGAVWGRSFGNPNYNGSDGFKCVIETADNNVLVVGNIYQSNLNSHPFVAKLNGANGDTLWTRALSFPLNQFGYHASEGPSGEIFVGISYDLRLVKLTASGNVSWAKNFASYGIVQRVLAQPDGSVIAAGQYLAASGTYNICLFKVSSNGTLMWFRDYDSGLPNNYEFINDAIASTDGGFYMAGWQYSNTNFTGEYPLVIKADSVGNLQWAKTMNTVVGDAKTLLIRNNGLLVGIDYAEGTQSNKPDVLLVTLDVNGSNDCFLNHPMVAGNPAITASNSAAYQYTDYETQVTPTSFLSQNFWRKTLCNGTTGETEIELSDDPFFEVNQLNGLIEIQNNSGGNFSYFLMDMTGRVIAGDKRVSGNVTISLQNLSGQLYLLKLQSEKGEQVVKIFN